VSGALQFNTSGRRGVGFARKYGTEIAQTLQHDMVCYLDADDILMPRALEAMLRTLAARPACYVYGDGYNLRGGKATYYRAAEYDRAIYGRMNIHNVTALMPTSVALAGEWTNRHWEDYLFYCSLALQGYCGVRAPYPVIAYDMAAGFRREMATNEGAGYANGLAAEYQAKFLSSGGATMGCCGSSGPQGAALAAMVEAAPGVAQPDGTVAMAYSGNAAGGVRYSVNGRQYTGKIGGVVYAHPDDVARLEQIGVFYQVPATPDGEETIKLAEEYDALVLGSPPGAEVTQAADNDTIADRIADLLANAANASSEAVSDLAHGMAVADSQREADLNSLFDADPLTVDAAGNVLAQVEIPAGDDEGEPDGNAYRAHRIDGGENGPLGSPPPPRIPLDDNADRNEPDVSEPPAEAPAKPKRGRKPAAKS
jgi:hypothetical protein